FVGILVESELARAAGIVEGEQAHLLVGFGLAPAVSVGLLPGQNKRPGLALGDGVARAEIVVIDDAPQGLLSGAGLGLHLPLAILRRSVAWGDIDIAIEDHQGLPGPAGEALDEVGFVAAGAPGGVEDDHIPTLGG